MEFMVYRYYAEYRKTFLYTHKNTLYMVGCKKYMHTHTHTFHTMQSIVSCNVLSPPHFL